MGGFRDGRTWVLLTSGYSLALCVGLFGVSMRLGEHVFAAYAAISGIFFLTVLLSSPKMLAAKQRRWWFAIAALVAIGICSFGQIAGFLFFAAPLATYLVLFLAPYGFPRDRQRRTPAAAGRRAAA